VCVEFAEDIGRHKDADSLHVDEAVKIALRKKMMLIAERHQMPGERRNASELIGERRQIHAPRMHCEAKAVDAPEHKEGHHGDRAQAERNAGGVATGPRAGCPPSGGYLSRGE
jgi:hypothetical protein